MENETTPRHDFGDDEVAMALHTVSLHREAISAFIAAVPPGDMLIALAFLRGALETQIEGAQEMSEDMVGFFRATYPGFLQANLKDGETLAEDQVMVIIPNMKEGEPPAPYFSADDDTPRIIQPGSSGIN